MRHAYNTMREIMNGGPRGFGLSWTRFDWKALIALGIAVGGWVYTLGVQAQRIQTTESAIARLQTVDTAQMEILIRIDKNLVALNTKMDILFGVPK
jgi:hypothetical protein